MATKDLVTTALADNIDQLRTVFNTEIGEVLSKRMDERKQEIAKSYFAQATVADKEAE